MFDLMISRSGSKLGHLGQKLGHRAKSKENLVNTLVVTFLCSPKNFGGAYSRRFVRASVRPCVRASVRPYVRVSVRPCVRPALVHANSRKLLVGFQ